MSQQPQQKPPVTAVVGDGWAALGAVGFLAASGTPVCWIAGTGTRMLAPLPSFEVGPGIAAWQDLAERLQVECGELKTGSFLREFRNKAFRVPNWEKAPTVEARADVREELLWAPETRITSLFEARFEMTAGELEEKIRKRLLEMSHVRRVEGVPVNAIKMGESEEDAPVTLSLGNGESLPCSRVIYADRWNALAGIEGVTKPLPFVRGRDAVAALQAAMTHTQPVGAGVMEGFYCLLNKEAGEDFQRNVFGYFLEEGKRSVWTLFLTSEEVEDNHQIAKKLRRMKQALDKMFGENAEWVAGEFMANVKDELVRFEESIVFAGGKAPDAPIALPKTKNVFVMTDGYGPSRSFEQVALLLGEELGIRTVMPQTGLATEIQPMVQEESQDPAPEQLAGEA